MQARFRGRRLFRFSTQLRTVDWPEGRWQRTDSSGWFLSKRLLHASTASRALTSRCSHAASASGDRASLAAFSAAAKRCLIAANLRPRRLAKSFSVLSAGFGLDSTNYSRECSALWSNFSARRSASCRGPRSVAQRRSALSRLISSRRSVRRREWSAKAARRLAWSSRKRRVFLSRSMTVANASSSQSWTASPNWSRERPPL